MIFIHTSGTKDAYRLCKLDLSSYNICWLLCMHIVDECLENNLLRKSNIKVSANGLFLFERIKRKQYTNIYLCDVYVYITFALKVLS